MYNDGVFTLPAGDEAIPQGTIVVLSDGALLAAASADTPSYLGVAFEAAPAYGDVAVRRCSTGLCEVLAGGTVTAGDLLALADNGTVDTYSDETYVIGQAITGGASGDLITAYLLDTPLVYGS